MSEGMTFRYSPEPHPLAFKEGVTRGWLIISDGGSPGPAQIANAVVLCDSDGSIAIEQTSEWSETTIVDDGGASA